MNAALAGFKYDNHPVIPIHVPSDSNEVEIDGKKYPNDYFKEEDALKIKDIMKDDKMTRRKMRENHPEVADNMKLIFRHMQVTLHGYVFRKCKPGDGQSCQFCKDHPPRASQRLWSALPSKDSGGLFFDCEDDLSRPGHYRTLLDLLKNIKDVKIKPDGMFPDVTRCQVK